MVPFSFLGAVGDGSAGLSYGYALLQMVAALALVCGLAYVALRYGLRYLVPRSRTQGKRIRAEERCQLEPGRSLWLVEVEGRRWLVASSERGLTLLSELETGKQPSFEEVLAVAPEAGLAGSRKSSGHRCRGSSEAEGC